MIIGLTNTFIRFENEPFSECFWRDQFCEITGLPQKTKWFQWIFFQTDRARKAGFQQLNPARAAQLKGSNVKSAESLV